MPPSSTIDWQTAEAPSLADIERLAEHTLMRLPVTLRRLCAGVILQVDDFADDETLQALECEDSFDLLGLFRGRGLAHGEMQIDTGQMPNMVWLYRRPILDYWAEHRETLGAVVSHVLIHEIGHHFGFSDADIDAIEAEAESGS